MEDSSIPFLLLTFTYLSLSLPANAITADEAAFMSNLATALSPTPSGWSGPTYCKWPGVTCNSEGKVTSIDLASKSLSGTLPSDINQLSQLQALSLQKNQLSGSLPAISNLTSLRTLLLDNNEFSSVPPDFLLGLTGLQKFSISENPSLLPWRIPDHLAGSSGLASLFASRANVYGTIPDIFGSFPNLQSLRLSHNNLTGPLPPSFSASGIQILWLNNQQIGLSGRIDVLGAMVQLTQAWLHSNKFSGPIPKFPNSSPIFDLQLRDNQLTGILLPSLFSLPKLVNISLQNNKLQGPYPDFPKSLGVTLGSTNSFCHQLPGPCHPQVTSLLEVAKALGYPMVLAQSWRGNDACKGWSFISCDAGEQVTVVNFGKQKWSGWISPAFSNLTSLRSLILNDNDLSGTVPHTLTTLKELKLLDISNNNLSGPLPEFSSSVILKTEGNNLRAAGNTGSTDKNSVNGPGSDSDTTTTTSSKAGSSDSSSLGLLVGIVIGSAVFIGIVLLVFYSFYTKKRRRAGMVLSKSMKSLINDKTSNIQINQSYVSSSEINVYDGGNVAIPIEVLRQATNNFHESNVLGKGGFGVVYKGGLNDGTEVAVKRMESLNVGTKGMNEFQAEIGVLTKVRHRHLVGLLGSCINGDERLLVYEYMPQGTLGQHLFEYNEMGFLPLTWKQRITIGLDVARGIEYLHSLAQQSFIHRDLKPSNILLGTDMRAKVSDFGLVKSALDGKDSVETRLAGTFGYLAPEYAATGRVTVKVDVFAFGVVLMEMITGRKSLDETMPEEKTHLVSWFRKVIPNPDNIRNALDPCLNPDEETFRSICKVAELAGHCTAREAYTRPDMSHAVNVLSQLLDEWKPSADYEEEEDNDVFGDDNFTLSLPQALQIWQANEGTSTMTLSLYDPAPNVSKKRAVSNHRDQR